MTLERLQKFLSRAGVASRRAAEEWIKAGRVSVNGQVVTEMGTKVDPARDVVWVDGRQVTAEAAPVTLMLYKPYGYISSRRDPEGRRVVMDLLPERLRGRFYPVGRLDYDATGLLLLTSDGELAHRLMHPSHQVPRTYRVTVTGEVSQETLRQLRAGVEIDGREVAVAVTVKKREEDKTVLELTVWEGRYHLVKRLLDKVGHPVSKLKRIALGSLRLGSLTRGSYRPLTAAELSALKTEVGLK
ncbi:MAG: rRNA pseudouridine synthase [Deltaproteobacteria bacterium]|nr:rRNA pseudouridine synthase [Deltaproteobacteria bacterium]